MLKPQLAKVAPAALSASMRMSLAKENSLPAAHLSHRCNALQPAGFYGKEFQY